MNVSDLLIQKMNHPAWSTRELARLFEKIAIVRKRVWTLALLRGMFGGCWLWLISLLVFGTLCAHVPMPTQVRAGILILHVLAIVAGAWLGLRYAATGKQGIRGLRLRAWALHCEELYPAMRGTLVTCVDLAEDAEGRAAFETNPVALALLKETSKRFAFFDPIAAVPRRLYTLTQFGAALPLVLFGLLSFFYPGYTLATAKALYNYEMPVMAGFVADQDASGEITVSPGDTEVPRGGAVDITATFTLSGATQQIGNTSLRILEHTDKGDHVRAYPMLKDEKQKNVFHLKVRDIANPMDYQVTAELETIKTAPQKSTTRNVQTKLFKITPYDPPLIELIRSAIRFPEYTHLPEQQVDGTYIAGLKQSTVTVRVQSNHALQSARLVPVKGESLQGTINANGDELQRRTAEFTLVISGEQSLRLEVVDKSDRANVDQPVVMIHMQEDGVPVIKVKRPGGDWAVHRIAEVSFEIEATDDFGLRDVELEYRVNDGTPVTVPLYTPGEGQPQALQQTMTHLLAIEDLNLVVGDCIYYRFIARDMQAAQPKEGQEEKGAGYSQPYFLTIRPFEQIFLEGGSGPAASVSPAPNERQVIVATSRVADRMSQLPEAERKSMLSDISRTQREVRSLTERLKLKLLPTVPNRAERIAHLDSAIADMRKAEALLDADDPKGALAPENSALRHQIAALAGLPLMDVDGNGMPSPYPPDMPTALSGQKTESTKSKYELADKSSAMKLDKRLVEALENVRAFAKRQKEFTETLKREEAPQGEGGGSVGAQFEDTLKQAEENRRELEKLRETVERLADADEELAKKLRETLDQVGQELAKTAEALAKKDMVQAQGDNARAMEKLRELELDLNKALNQDAPGRLRAVKESLDAWIDRQKALKDESAALKAKQQDAGQATRFGLADQQAQLGSEMKETATSALPAVAAASGASGAKGAKGDNGAGGAGNSGTVGNSAPQQKSMQEAQSTLNAAAEESNLAAQDLKASRDATVANRQKAVLEQLERARNAVQQILDAMPDAPDGKLERALEAVRNIKKTLQPPETAPPPQGERVPDHPWSPQPPGPPIADAQKEINTLRELMGQDAQAGPLIQAIAEGPTGPNSGAQTGSPGSQGAGDSGRIAPDSPVWAALDRLEELLEQRLQLADQAQRLQQTPAEDLPPRFRDMASKYFEALGMHTQSESTPKTGSQHGSN